MFDTIGSVFMRIPFTLTQNELEDIDVLTLKMRYDDGFVAYINGVEVARTNAPEVAVPGWNATAADQHADPDATVLQEFYIPEHIRDLQAGDNLLAIQGLNTSLTSSDFLVSPELEVGELTGTAAADPGAVAYDGAVDLTGTAQVSARVLDGGKWSALTEATFVFPGLADSLRITEIMYHPQDPPSGNPDAEFIELKNVGTGAVNLVNTRFTEGIHFTFPDMQLDPGDSVIVVRDPSAFASHYPAFSGVIAGEYTGSLANDGERIRLEDPAGVEILDFRYSDGWYRITDGEGFSLTIADGAGGDKNRWGQKDGWRPSTFSGGSPGEDDGTGVPEPGAIVINEVLAHSHTDNPDWIELHNTTGGAINIGGWYLSDDPDDLMKYRIATGISIPAGGYVVLAEDTHFGTAFALSENGETVFLSSALGGVLTGYRVEEDFGASESNVAFGRYEKSTGAINFVAMSTNTPGVGNAYPKVGPVVINEIMYHPASADENEEYIELHNVTGLPVVLGQYDADRDETVAWRFTDGIVFTFPLDTTIPANGYLLVVKDPTRFGAAYSAAGGVTVLGPYDGQLSNAGERLELSMPGDVDGQGERQYIRIDRVNYDDADPWPTGPDGGGTSLTRRQPGEYGNDVANWADASPSPGK